MTGTISKAGLFVGTILGATRGTSFRLGADLEFGVEEASINLSASFSVVSVGAVVGRARSTVGVAVIALRISLASGSVVVSTLGGEATVGSHDLRALGNIGSSVRAVETSGVEADRFFRSPETGLLHHGEVDETIRNVDRVGRSEVGEGLRGTDQVVTTEEDTVGSNGVLLPLPDGSTVSLLSVTTEPDILSSEVGEEQLVNIHVGNSNEATGDATEDAGFTTSLGLSVGDLVGRDEFDGSVGGDISIVDIDRTSSGTR